MSSNLRLLFVYNADSGLFNQLTDYAHKIISPATYSCNLCKLTYSNFSIQRGWKNFLNSLHAEKAFLHRDEFAARYPKLADTPLPAIFSFKQGIPALLLSDETINNVKSLDDLQHLLNDKINKL
ncbi:hypothetical protein HYV57_00330 [Candidatus Peregrinibacteria bacterium]|nr:hypothetical protein [Candidatus Peregrinibacteria bacterium]